MIHPQNAEQIEQMTGLSEHSLPQEVRDEYMEQLRMFHRTRSSGGALPVEMLIPLMRSFGITGPTAEKREANRTKWGEVAVGTKVLVNVAGHFKDAIFRGVVAGGTLAVKLEDDSKVLEVRPDRVKIDRSIPEDIRQETMVDDVNDEKPAKDVDEPELPEHWNKTDYVLVDGDKVGILVGETPDNPREYTVEIDGEFVSVPKAVVADASPD